ncbi:lachrymatory-factor synthase [Trifolium repens]|nr:lachrymatory-factor synthase [Trifolium repens]
MGEESQPKWEGKVTIDATSITAQQVWLVLQDFCNLHKWIPIETCYQLEGIQNQPGLIRYCASTIKAASDDSESESTIKWAKEKLLKIDPIKRCLSYEIVDNNMGFKSYVATLKVVPINDDDDDDEAGCVIEWGYVCDPVEGWTLEAFTSYIEYCLQFMAKKIEVESSC